MKHQTEKEPNLLNLLDKEYLNSINAVPKALSDTYTKLLSSYTFDLSKLEITEAVVNRLKHHYQSQNYVKQLLDKRKMKDGADFFVESVLFFFKLYLERNYPHIKIYSEIAIVRAKGAIRPDISIWNGGELIAIIECKTQLGFSRNSWEEEFSRRKQILETSYPNANFMLLVMTGNNWKGFQGHKLIGLNLFCLLKDAWPTNYNSREQIETPLEKLFRTVEDLIINSITL